MQQDIETKHFLEYWQVVQSRKEIILAILFLFLVVGVVVTLWIPKSYQATTRMTVKRVQADIAVFESQNRDRGYDPFFLKTQLEIIKSQLVLDEVIRNLGLVDKFAKIQNRQTMSLADARRELTRSISVSPELDTNIIEIRVSRRTPEKGVMKDVASIANEIADVYERTSKSMSGKKTTKVLEDLEEEVRRYAKLVKEREIEVERLRTSLSITASPMRGTEGEALERMRLQQLETERSKARRVMLDRKARLDNLKGMGEAELVYALGYLMNDAILRSLRRDLTDAKLQLKILEEDHGERHPDVVRTKAGISELNREITQAVNGAKVALQTDYDIAKRNYEEIDADLKSEKQADILRSGEQYLPFYRAKDELVNLRTVKDALETRWIILKTEKKLPQTPVTIIDRAEEPRESDYVSPNIVLNIFLSLIMGIGCGVGIAFFSEYIDTSVKSIEDIEQFLGAPVIAVIPQKVKSLLEVGEGSQHSEAYRVLRTNIQLSKKLKGGKAICVTSGGASEGKSFTISNLGFIAARQGDKVLVVDSDMRRPRQHRIFGVTRKPGLSDVLRGDVKIESVVQSTPNERLFILPSGRSAVGSAGLLDSQRMQDIIDYLKGQFDYVLFDAPPMIGVSDASVLVSKVDAVILVVQHRGYPRTVCERAKRMVDDLGGNLLGVVLNNINISRDHYYYHHSYAGHYNYTKPKPSLLVDSEHDDDDDSIEGKT